MRLSRLLAIILLLALPTWAVVTVDAVGPGATGTSISASTPLTWTHVVSGANTLLVVVVAVSRNPDTGNSVTATYNSVSMTSVAVVHSHNSTGGFVQMLYLVNPASGSHTVSLSIAGTLTSEVTIAGSVSFNGVNQTTPIGHTATAFGSGTTASVAVTSSS